MLVDGIMSDMKRKQFKVSFVGAVVVHVAVFILLCVSLKFIPEVASHAEQTVEVIQAVTIDQDEVRKEITKIKEQERIKENAAIAKQKYLKHLADQAEARRKKAEKDIQQLKLHQKELEKQQLVKQQAEERKLAQMKQQQASEQKRLMDLKKRVAKTIEKKKLAEQSAKEMLENQLAKEQQQLNRLHDRQMQSEIARYEALILNAIGQHWIIPPHVNKDLSTQVLIRLAPGGVVLNVKMLKSSGDAMLDRSAINAIWKTSPLPVPEDARLFEKFRELRLTVKPRNVL
jgi:colicin import membrane protein